MKTLRLNLFWATFMTALSLFLVLVPYSIFLGWNLFTALFFWFILLPIATNLASYFFKPTGNLQVAVLGELVFYAFVIFMTYKHHMSDQFTVMLYSILPSILLLVLYNYRQIPVPRRS